MDVLMNTILNVAYVAVAILALLGAIDFMKESLVIFKEALRKRRERNGRQ